MPVIGASRAGLEVRTSRILRPAWKRRRIYSACAARQCRGARQWPDEKLNDYKAEKYQRLREVTHACHACAIIIDCEPMKKIFAPLLKFVPHN